MLPGQGFSNNRFKRWSIDHNSSNIMLESINESARHRKLMDKYSLALIESIFVVMVDQWHFV
jgi:hypothetical protein